MVEYPILKSDISGIILAGGKSSRMGEDKGLIKIKTRPLINFVIARVRQQVDSISINTNQNIPAYRDLKFPIITDENPHRLGPLSGMLSCLNKISTHWAFFCACDIPRIPADVVEHLATVAQQQQKQLAVVKTGDRLQPLCSLIHRDLANSIKTFLDTGSRKTQDWQLAQNPAILDYTHQSEAFLNINTPEQKLHFENSLLAEPGHG